MKANYTICFLSLVVGLLGSSAALADFHPLEDIRHSAENAIHKQYNYNENTSIKAGYLDPRLRLAKCMSPLMAKPLNKKQRNTNSTVIVKCNDSKPWTIYVPVQVKSYIKVYVAVRPLAKGIPIQASDVVIEKREVTTLTRGYLKALDAITGKSPKRVITRGAVISPRDFAIENIIRKGNRVSIVAETSGITVRMPGKALSDATKGEVIPVRNLSSNRTIEAVVLEPGIVKVPM